MLDNQIEELIAKESRRQSSVINLIASENIISDDIAQALGSVFANKYAEGYAHARYYGGNTYVDELEDLTKSRALELFNLNPDEWAVNVQALSGSPANFAVIASVCEIGEKLMGMSLNSGGHLTHGHKASMTGKLWQQVPYSVSSTTELLDFSDINKIAQTEKPKMLIAGFTAYPRIVDWSQFSKICRENNIHFHVDMSHIAGLVAGGVHPSPFDFADTVMTTTHKTLRGPRSALIFTRKSMQDKEGKFIYKKIDSMIFPGLCGGPHMDQIAGVAICLQEANSPEFKDYAKKVVQNSQALAEELINLGWRLSSGGTDTHLTLMDTYLSGAGVTGQVASDLLEENGIIVNKNSLPSDLLSVKDASGIRLGSACETTRGKTEKDFREFAIRIDHVLRRAIDGVLHTPKGRTLSPVEGTALI